MNTAPYFGAIASPAHSWVREFLAAPAQPTAAERRLQELADR